ncbi:hypothetical protein HAZT_HAZT004449 [Hyalella azteca]|uniref:Uncharacterized protein n=1 Tax=Hyalella azteca TaxID=294128 RepID=A0A6A0H9M1_HYAAZ|nr:hypothetical protein HAZT_HAZT004449 [Hyalella azteca]
MFHVCEKICLAAGSSILNRESESSRMRPLAKAVTKTIETVRNLLREQCLKSEQEFTEKIRESLKIFDLLFSEFELSYVSAMVPVKSPEEYEVLQCVVVLFSETVQRALLLALITQEQVDTCDPALMFTIPRLAIVAGLLFFPDGPLNLDHGSSRNLSHLFRPFKTHQGMKTLASSDFSFPEELAALEKSLCSLEEPQHSSLSLPENSTYSLPNYDDKRPEDRGPKEEVEIPVAFRNAAFTSSFIQNFLQRHPECRTLTAEDNLLPAQVRWLYIG